MGITADRAVLGILGMTPKLPEEIQLALIAAFVAIIGASAAMIVRRLNSLDRTLNHKPAGSASIGTQVDETHGTALQVLTAISELRDEQNGRHAANERRFEQVDRNVNAQWRSLLHIRGMVNTIGDSLGVPLPPPPVGAEPEPPWDPSQGDRRRGDT